MKINEIVVISGKGGTGKTTLTSSIIPYMDSLVIADCDVDAPDLDILLEPTLNSKSDFHGLKKAFINEELCNHCDLCEAVCKFSIKFCEGCGACTIVCPKNAIEMVDSITGHLLNSTCSFGNIFHGKLIPGEEASGKLVSKIRKEAKSFAKKNNLKNILIDGSPGIACNVISSIMGVSKAIIVVEPTVSGIHDLKRVYQLISKYPILPIIVINKFDLSLEKTEEIETYAKENSIDIGLKIPFNKKIVEAIVKKEIPSIAQREFFENIGFFNFIETLKN